MTELFAARDRPTGFGDRGGATGRAVGRALHGRWQHERAGRDPSFRAEVALETKLVHRGWTAVLRGRADGVRNGVAADAADTAAGASIEELKSHWPTPASASGGPPADAATRAAARRQVAVYAWLWARERGPVAAAEVVWLEVTAASPSGPASGGADSGVRREAVAFDPETVEREIRAALDAWIERIEQDAAERTARRTAAGRLALPHPAWRPGQAELAEAVERALREREQLLVEAPPGIGKTLAALLPALRFALAGDKRVLFLSATGLGQRAAADVLARLAPATRRAAVRLRARARLCPHDVPVCHEAACELARGHAEGLRREALPASLFDGAPLLEPEVLRTRALAAGVCPFELSLEAAAAAVVTVGDLNYAFDPGVRLLDADDPALGDVILIADEVHRLGPRVRDALGAELDAGTLRRAAERATLSGAPVHARQAALCTALAERVEVLAAELAPGAPPDFELEAEVPDGLVADLRDELDLVLLATLAYRRATGALDADDPYLAVWTAAQRLEATLARARRSDFGTLLSARGGVPRLRRVCLDPAPWIAPIVRGAHAFVGLSATLEPRDLVESELGLDPARRAHAAAPDPFALDARRLVIDPRIDTRHGARAREAPRIARRLAELAGAVPAGCLALLGSHAALAEVRATLPPVDGDVVWQRPDDDEAARGDLWATLAAGRRTLVLAVAGGVLAESIDLPAGALSAVAVVGPCLPAATGERRLLEAHWEEMAGAGFAWAYAAPGMARVLQAAGRLVRSDEHRGVIALLGRRFLREPYRSALPESLLRGEPPEAFRGDPAAAARDFFAGAP